MSQLPTFIQYIQALGPILVAVAVGYVAYQQWDTSRAKLKLDLFELRFAAFVAARTIVAAVLHNRDEIASEDLKEEYDVLEQNKLLFHFEIAKEIDRLMNLCRDYRYLCDDIREFEGTTVQSEVVRAKKAERVRRRQETITQAVGILKRVEESIRIDWKG
jgi:hypothetical protein